MPTAKHVVKERTNPDPKDPLLAIEKKTKHANLLEQQRIEHQNLGRRYKKEIEELKAKHEQETREFVVACKEERSAKGSTEPRGNCGSQVEKNGVPREADDRRAVNAVSPASAPTANGHRSVTFMVLSMDSLTSAQKRPRFAISVRVVSLAKEAMDAASGTVPSALVFFLLTPGSSVIVQNHSICSEQAEKTAARASTKPFVGDALLFGLVRRLIIQFSLLCFSSSITSPFLLRYFDSECTLLRFPIVVKLRHHAVSSSLLPPPRVGRSSRPAEVSPNTVFLLWDQPQAITVTSGTSLLE